MRERDIQAKVVGYARAKRVIARKLDFGQGWPDYMMLFNGKILFMEFKQPGKHPEPLQQHVISILKKTGFDVMVIDSVAEGELEIDEFVSQPGKGMVDYSDIIKQTVENRR